MPALPTNSTLLDQIQHELRIPTSNTVERAKIQAVMSYVYGDICAKQDWWWLQRRSVINTVPRIDTGTVSLTADTTAITFSTAPQQYSANVSVKNYMLMIPSNATDPGAVYRIAAHTSGATAATLDGAYTGATATAAAFKLYLTTYALPTDVAKLTSVKRFGRREPITPIGIGELSFLQQTDTSEGLPRVYSIFDFATANTVSSARMLNLHPYPDTNAHRLEIWYKHQQAGDTATDLDLPIDYQGTLVYGALARCYPIFLNDLERGAFCQSVFNDVMALMAAQQREYAVDHPGVAIDMRMYRFGGSRARVTGTYGALFDTLPNVP